MTQYANVEFIVARIFDIIFGLLCAERNNLLCELVRCADTFIYAYNTLKKKKNDNRTYIIIIKIKIKKIRSPRCWKVVLSSYRSSEVINKIRRDIDARKFRRRRSNRENWPGKSTRIIVVFGNLFALTKRSRFLADFLSRKFSPTINQRAIAEFFSFDVRQPIKINLKMTIYRLYSGLLLNLRHDFVSRRRVRCFVALHAFLFPCLFCDFKLQGGAVKSHDSIHHSLPSVSSSPVPAPNHKFRKSLNAVHRRLGKEDILKMIVVVLARDKINNREKYFKRFFANTAN
ncbi:hypothetical protein PUN28_008598 [Cardiocondyla obscurior]|uniref:Uncharacterized protein n=1 Tax=Cardiocondyla obscurior TaxID=286306 RepID=A0AAW2G0A7_9HYME